jgi:hypothetical protein
MHYYPEFKENIVPMYYAGIMMIKKNIQTLKFIQEWLELCEIYNLLDSSKSLKYNEIDSFQGNDADNGLFNLCLYKNMIHIDIPYYETNLHSPDGCQLLRNNHHWNLLMDYPIQLRRLNKN